MEWSHGAEAWSGAMEWSYGVEPQSGVMEWITTDFHEIGGFRMGLGSRTNPVDFGDDPDLVIYMF